MRIVKNALRETIMKLIVITNLVQTRVAMWNQLRNQVLQLKNLQKFLQQMHQVNQKLHSLVE